MGAIFNIIATPMGYVMEWIYNTVLNYGYSILAFALLAKVIMLPFSIKQKRSMITTQRINPKLRELQKKYGHDKEKYSQEMQRLYADYGASPMGGCGTSLLTLPIMLGLYYVVTMPITYMMHVPTEEITAIAQALGVETTKFGFQMTIAGMLNESFDAVKHLSANLMPLDFTFFCLDLSQTPSFKEPALNWIIPILSAATSWGYTHVMNTMNQVISINVNGKKPDGDDEKVQQMNKSMNLMMPLMSGYFGFVLPGAVGLYWIANNLFMCVQEVALTSYCLRKDKEEIELYKTGGNRVK